MNSLKKVVILILTAICTLSAAGCAKEKKSVDSRHFSVFVIGTEEQPSPDNKILKKLEEDLGYTFDFEFLAGNQDEKMGVMIASGDYADIVACGDNKLIQAGALVPLDDYITEEKTPNLYNLLKEDWNKLCYQEDGHLYVIPNYGIQDRTLTDGIYEGPAFWIQKAVLEEAGYPSIRTLDEYFEIIETYKDRHAMIDGMKTVGFDILTATNYEWVLTTAPNYLDGNPNDGAVKVDKSTYKAKIFADSDFSKQYYKKLNEEYAKGIIEPEAFTQNLEQYQEKIASGRVLGMFDQHWVFQAAEETLAARGLYEREYVPLPITFDESIEPWYRSQDTPNIGQGYGISVRCQDPEAVINMFEVLLSERWQKIFQWGFEGEDYLIDDNGRMYRTPEQRAVQNDPVWKTKNRLNALFHNLPKTEVEYADGNGASPSQQYEEFAASLSEYDKKFLAAYNKKDWVEFMNTPPENPVYYPAWTIDLIDGSEADYVNQNLTDLALKYIPRMIMADSSHFDRIWEEYCSEIGKINTSAYEKRINEQIQWRLEHWQ